MIKNEWNKINVEGIKLDMENWTKKLDEEEKNVYYIGGNKNDEMKPT